MQVWENILCLIISNNFMKHILLWNGCTHTHTHTYIYIYMRKNFELKPTVQNLKISLRCNTFMVEGLGKCVRVLICKCIWFISTIHSLFLIILIIIYSLRVFHISFSGWSFTGVWVTVSLLKSPGLVSVFRPFSIML